MRSRKKLMALAVTGVLAAGGAVATTAFEGRIVCDQDPRVASTASCVLDMSGNSPSETTEPMHLTYYGQSDEDWMSLETSVPTYDYYVLQEESDPLAGFEWVLGPELVGYYLSPDAYYVTDASTGEVTVIHGAG